MPGARARQTSQKEARRQDILAMAGDMFADMPFQAIAMAQVAERAGVAKGTVYLYFPSKEALFLALLEAALDDWFERFNARLTAERPGVSGRALARLIRQSLAPAPALPRLLGLLHAVLVPNLPPEQVIAFEGRLVEARAVTGALLESKLPQLASGQGARLMLRVHALVVGLHQLAAPGPAGDEIGIAEELEATLAALFAGLERDGGNDEPRIERKNSPGHGRFERPWG